MVGQQLVHQQDLWLGSTLYINAIVSFAGLQGSGL